MHRNSLPLCLALVVLPAGQGADKPMPTQAGVLPNQKQVQVRLQQGSVHLPAAEVRAALSGAIGAWNAVLPADLKLVETPMTAPLPEGEVVFLVRFDADPSHFPQSGVDEVGDIRGIIDRGKNHAIVALFFVDKPGALSTSGAAASRDLQLVMMHELGHALGIPHENGATGMPPIMAPALEETGKLLARTGKSLAALRQLTAADKSLLEIGTLKRASRDVSGSYTGTLTVTKVEGTGNLTVGSTIPVRAGQLVITFEAGKVKLNYRESLRELPAVDLYNSETRLEFPDLADGRTLRTMTISRGNTPEEIEVVATIKALVATYTLTGTMKRPSP